VDVSPANTASSAAGNARGLAPTILALAAQNGVRFPCLCESLELPFAVESLSTLLRASLFEIDCCVGVIGGTDADLDFLEGRAECWFLLEL